MLGVRGKDNKLSGNEIEFIKEHVFLCYSQNYLAYLEVRKVGKVFL